MISKIGNIPVTDGNKCPELVTFTSKNTYVREIYEEIGQIVASLTLNEEHNFECGPFNRGRFKLVFYKAAKHYGVLIRISIRTNSLLITRLS